MASPTELSQPSTWQLLFGKKGKANATVASNQLATSEATPSTANISDQLLRNLNTRRPPSSEAEIGRECSEELLGRPNAFTHHLQLEHLHSARDIDRDAKVKANEIIAARFHVEAQADAIRHGQKGKIERRREMQTRTTVLHKGKPRPEPSQAMSGRLEKLREIQHRREEQQGKDNNRVHTSQQRTRTLKVAGSSTGRCMSKAGISKTTRCPEAETEANHAAPSRAGRERVNAKKLATNPDPRVTSGVRARDNGSNQDDAEASPLAHRMAQHTKRSEKAPEESCTPLSDERGRALRRLEGKLRALEEENQKAIDLEEKLHRKQCELQIKRRVWALWRARVETRRRQELGVLRARQWRLLQRLWMAWRNHVRICKRQHEADQERQSLVRQKEQEEMADRYFRGHNLARWFLRWRAITNAQREATTFEREMKRRREKADQLMNRYKQTPKHEEAAGLSTLEASQRAAEQNAKPVPESEPSQRPMMSKQNIDPRPARKAAWSAEPVVSTAEVSRAPPASAAPSPDAFYVSMQERAIQRKERREQLRKKYEKLEQEKQEALERQVAERELLLQQRKEEERECLREKRREETRLAREKEAQRHIAIVKMQSADLHNRLRQLYHYGWRPWQQQWLALRRVASNASRWHALRVLYRACYAWKEFIELKKHAQRQREREHEEHAVAFHQVKLVRKIMEAWRSVCQSTRHKELALQRQTKWNEVWACWRRWQHVYAVALSVQNQREQDARARLGRMTLRRVIHAWQGATADSQRERQRLREKEALLKKARMWLAS